MGRERKPVCKECKQQTCTKLRTEEAKLKRFKIDAQAADAAYSDNPIPPKGFRNATDDDLNNLGLTRDYIQNPIDKKTGQPTNFKTAVFVNESNGEKIIAFRGSTLSGDDWTTNAKQGLGKETFYYTRAQNIAKRIADSPGGGNARFTGHSLGGGLASAAARATGKDATTFNAAGLHQDTVKDPNSAGQIDAVYVRGEALTTAQNLPGLAKAAASKSWPLDPPPSIGVAILKRLAGAIGGLKGRAAAAVIRSADLHRMKHVHSSLDQREQQVAKNIEANGC